MVEIRRGTIAFVLGAAVLAVAVASGPAWSQPPVAKPQPPPAATPAAPVTPAATAPRPPATQPAASQPGTAAAQPSVKPAAGAAVTPAPAKPIAAGTPAAARTPAVAASAGSQPPPESVLGVPVLPNAQYIGSYDAGGAGQRFYLFGTVQGFLDVVAYYRTVLKQKGELVFDMPPTHMFDVGKFKEADVAFPPGVTVKDYALSGAAGLANPKPGATPSAFPTVIQIVPPPELPPARPR